MYSQSLFLAKIKNIKTFQMDFLIFTTKKKYLYIAWASFRNAVIETITQTFWKCMLVRCSLPLLPYIIFFIKYTCIITIANI